MFCKKCGKEILEDQEFCTQCGAEVENSVEAEASAAQPEGDIGFVIDSAEEATDVEKVRPVKKKKTGLIVAIASAAVVVVLAVLAIFNFNALKGFAVKTFGTDTDYLRFVEAQSFNNGIDAFTEAYGAVLEEKEEQTASVKLQPKLSQSAQDLIGENLTGELDIDWINKLSLSATAKVDKNKIAEDIVLALSDSEVLKLNAVADMEQQALYFALSNLSDKYVKVDMGLDESVELGEAELSKIMETLDDPEFKKALPTEEALNELLTKYSDVILNNLEAVSTSTMYLTVGELTGDFTVIEYKITEKDALNIAEEMLNLAKDDAELKAMIESVCGYLSDKEIIDSDINYYDEFKDFIEEGLDAVEGAKDDAGEDDPIVLKSFVNSKHEVCGRVIEADGEELFRYVTVQNGTKFASEAEADNVKIEGNGEVKGTKLNAEYTVKVDGKSYVDVIVEDADVVILSDEKFNGTVRVELGDALIEEMGDSQFASVMNEYDFSLELKMAADKKTSKLEINLLSKGELFAGFDITSTLEKADGAVSVPADAIDATDDEAMAEWLKKLDLDTIPEALKKGGLNEELVTFVESYVEQIKGMMDPDSYYDDMYGSADNVYSDAEGVLAY